MDGTECVWLGFAGITPLSLGSTHQTLAGTLGRILVMLSGGGDSVALLDVAVRAKGAAQIEALHVNYGLRSDSALDQRHCELLCERLGIRLYVREVVLPGSGNMHANARAERYRIAREIVRDRGIEWIATAHTADDQAETVLYRLVSSPGRRALRGIPERDGDLIRPLLGVRRGELRAYLAERGLEWREDSSNADPRFARARVRRVLAELEDVHPAALANVNATAELMRVEEDAVRELVLERLEALRARDGSLAIEDLAELHPAVAALALRELAEAATGRPVPAAYRRVADVLALSARGGTRRTDLGAGAVAEVAYGRLRVYAEPTAIGDKPDSPAGQLLLDLPGRHDFHGWRITAEPAGNGVSANGTGHTVTTAAVGAPYEIELNLTPSAARNLLVRSRRQGDRLRPVGLGGSKSLQDVFVDRKIPRALRDSYPVVCCGDDIVWVPGVVVGEPSAGLADAGDGLVTARLSASPPPPESSRPVP